MPDFLTPVQQILTSGLQSGSSNPVTAYALGGPTFRTEQQGIDLSRQVRYALLNASLPVAGNGVTSSSVPQSLIFPVSPQSMMIQRNSLVNWYETQGQVGTSSSSRLNVQRIMDLYGLTPMIFTIRGTTGYNKYFVDGFQKTGTEWMQVLQTFIEQYFQDLQENYLQPDDMQFLDFWYQEYWHVVPVGPVVIRQANDRPLWMFYELTLAGTTRLSDKQQTISENAINNSLPQSQTNMGIIQQIMAGVITGAVLTGLI